MTPTRKAELRALAERLQEVERPLPDRAASAIFELLGEIERLEKLDREYGEVESQIILCDPAFDGDSEHPSCKDRLIDAVNRMADRAETAEAKLATERRPT